MPRLKWLFMCEEMTQQMRRNKEGLRDSKDVDIMSHHVDAEAWQALDRFDPEFAGDPMSVRLGLSMDGFQPYSSDSTVYSCWPVFVMPYNLPLNKYLKQGFIFLALMILSPKELKKQINIFLCLLMEELKELWQTVDVYDSHLKCRLNLCTVYLWSIHNYMSYENLLAGVSMVDSIVQYVWMTLMHSGWSTTGKSLFYCRQRFIPLSHEFRGDKQSFQRGKTVRKGSPKRKLGADIVKMLDDLKES
jgi:hypothetical protein